MKKLLALFCFVYCSSIMSYAQDNVPDYLTEEEKSVTEKDQDNAYLAPSSKFVGKTWYSHPAGHWIFNSNGTGRIEEEYIDKDYGETILIVERHPITWKRDKQFINLSVNSRQMTYGPAASELKKLSLRKQDEIKKNYSRSQERKRSNQQNDKYEAKLLKITNDIMIMDIIDLNTREGYRKYLFSKKLMDELTKRYEQRRR